MATPLSLILPVAVLNLTLQLYILLLTRLLQLLLVQTTSVTSVKYHHQMIILLIQQLPLHHWKPHQLHHLITLKLYQLPHQLILFLKEPPVSHQQRYCHNQLYQVNQRPHHYHQTTLPLQLNLIYQFLAPTTKVQQHHTVVYLLRKH